MIWDTVAQIETAEPPVSQVQMHLFTKPPLGPNAEAIAYQKHTDQQLGIDRGAARVAVEIRQVLADAAQISEPINRSQQVVLWDVLFQRKLIEQRCLRFLPRSQHRSISHLNVEMESVNVPRINDSFSTK